MSSHPTFDGTFYKEVGNFIGENYLKYGFTKGTMQEVDFLADLLELRAGQRVLDIGCGPGRHSLELARRGVSTYGVDISDTFVELANRKAAEEKLNAEFRMADARDLQFENEFDAVICLCQGAFGLAGDEEGHRRVLQGVRRALKPGGTFVLTAIHALSAARRRPSGSSFNAYTNTDVEAEIVTSPHGETKSVDIYTTAFTYRELKLLFESAGFVTTAAYGCVAGRFARKPLTLDDIEIMMVAERI